MINAAFITKYLGPTNHQGSRIVVKFKDRSTRVPYDHELNADANHRAAVYAMVKRFDIRLPCDDLHTGQLNDGRQVHVIPAN